MQPGFLFAIGSVFLVSSLTPLAFCQPPNVGPRDETAPIYRITVVGRTSKAVNYQYRSDPTMVDLQGTVLLPRAKGDAIVKSRQGRTEIDAHLDGLTTPQRYGGEYLTYVLWAVTPQGRPHNIGELIPDSGNKARVHVTTDLQAFALIVTAEPYSAVRQPSNVVVAENQIRPDTLGKIESVDAKYELLPRGAYTWQVPNELTAAIANAPKVSMHEYEALLQLYQAQNAVGSARSAHADRYAADTFARAEQLLAQAQQLHDRKGEFRRVVENAREAAQTAEDSRVLALQRQQAEHLTAANATLARTQAELAQANQARSQAQVDAESARAQARQAQADAEAARAQSQAALAARTQAESEAAEARQRAATELYKVEVAKANAAHERSDPDSAQKREARARLLEALRLGLPALDTGRGLVLTVPDDSFRGTAVLSTDRLARIAAVLAQHPDLAVSVEGYSDAPGKETFCQERAAAVRRTLIGAGVPAGAITTKGLGDTRPVGPNSTAQERRANSRVEIVISGDAIGKLPVWERTYTLHPTAPTPDNRQ